MCTLLQARDRRWRASGLTSQRRPAVTSGQTRPLVRRFPSTPTLAAHDPRRPFARPGYRASGTGGFSGDCGSGAELNLPTAEAPGGVRWTRPGTR
jgi:hypothetical protein